MQSDTLFRLCLVLSAFTCVTGSASAGKPRVDWAKQLSDYEHSVDSHQGVREVLDSGDWSVQLIAIYALLQSETKEYAIGQLQEFIYADHQLVRAHAAAQLADLGDHSGLERMQRDFRDHVLDDISIQKSVAQIEVRNLAGKSDSSVADVLEVAIALAKMGDTRVGPFVQYMCIHGSGAGERYRATRAMAALVSAGDLKALEKNEVFPLRTLERVARNDSNELVRKVLRSEMSNLQIKPDYALRIFKAMRKSRFISNREEEALTICEKEKILTINSYVPYSISPDLDLE